MKQRLQALLFSRTFLNRTGLALSALALAALLFLLAGTLIAPDLEDAGFLVVLACWLFVLLLAASLLRLVVLLVQMMKAKNRLWFLVGAVLVVISCLFGFLRLEQVWVWQKIARGWWNLSETGYKMVLQLSSLPALMYCFFGLQVLSGLLPLREKAR